jgi:hypothetical protein
MLKPLFLWLACVVGCSKGYGFRVRGDGESCW